MKSLATARFCVLCVQTLNNTRANMPVVEIVCHRVQGVKVIATHESKVNPEVFIPEEWTRQTGLYASDYEAFPILDDVLLALAEFIGRDTIVWPEKGKGNQVTRFFHNLQFADRHLYLTVLGQKLYKTEPLTFKRLSQHLKLPYTEFNIQAQSKSTAQSLIQLLQEAEAQGIHSISTLLLECATVKVPRRIRRQLPFDVDKLKEYPTQPGVYFMKNRLDEILYVGKAKNLRTRLRSYFQKQSQLPPKVATMMQQVAKIDVETVGSELEALLLEARLIKEHQPFFNRKVKHFQHMVYLKIGMNEAYPQLSLALETDEAKAIYLGPFASKTTISWQIDTINRVFKLRSCDDQLFAKHAQSPCTQYQIGLCSGPCAKKISKKDYKASVQDFLNYLRQERSDTVDLLLAKRDAYSEALQFEKAATVQTLLEDLEALQLRSEQLLKTVEEHHCLLVLPASEPDAFRLLGVLAGVPQAWFTFHPEQDDWKTLIQWLEPVMKRSQKPSPLNISKVLYEEARLISQWLNQREENPEENNGAVLPFEEQTLESMLDELYRLFKQQKLVRLR